MECDDCQKWTHIKCATITPAQYDDFMNMKEDDLLWQCHICKSTDGTTDLPTTNEATATSQDLPSYNATPSRYCDLTVMSVNCNSLVSHSKQAQLLQLIDSHSPDIICGCESKLSPTLVTAEIFPTNDYAIYRKDKSEGEGGVFIAVKHNIGSVEEISLDSNCQIIWCSIQRKNAPLHWFILSTTNSWAKPY